MNGVIARNTSVVSISLAPSLVRMLDTTRRKSRQTRSAFIASLVEQAALHEKWKELRSFGDKTAATLKIASEDDVYRMLGDV